MKKNYLFLTAMIFAMLFLMANIATPAANILTNPGFESGTASWNFFGTGTYAIVSPAYEGTNASKITITSYSTNIQLYQYNLVLEPNTKYRIRFAAYSSTGRDLEVLLHKQVSPYTGYGLDYIAGLSTSWQTFTTEFTTTGFAGAVNDGRLRFWFVPFASAGDIYYIDDIVLEKLVSPNITAQPASQSVIEGSSATFSVAADGSSTLSYQWQRNGTNIAGATGPSYAITTSLADNNSAFRVNVSNPAGSVLSNAAILTVSAQPAAMTAYLNFNEGAGTAAADSSGFGNVGALYGMNPGINNGSSGWTSSGRLGNALQFDGANDYVSVGDAPSLRPRNFTIEGWFYKKSDYGAQVLVSKQYTGAQSYWMDSYAIFSDASNIFSFYGYAGGADIIANSAVPLPLNRWTHFAVTYDSSSLKMYLNGTLVLGRPLSGVVSYDSSPVLIGADDDSSNEQYSFFFNGTVDEVKIWNKALSAADIQAEYLAGLTDLTPPSISIDFPSNGQSFITSPITVSGTASDNYALSNVEVKVNSGAWQTASGTAAWNASISLAQGSNNITAKATDTSGNSNSSSVTVTYISDTSSPAKIDSLMAYNATFDSITLNWTAPGGDGNTGTAASYDIRYSTSMITDASWTAATPALNEPAPLAAGTAQAFAVTDLLPGTTYYFAIKAADDAGNIGVLSNVANADTVAPIYLYISAKTLFDTYNLGEYVALG